MRARPHPPRLAILLFLLQIPVLSPLLPHATAGAAVAPAPHAVRPPQRQEHSAIYDPVGHRMLVFGGASDGGLLNDVWQLSLDPVGDWSPLETVGTAPSPRWGHSAVYDPARRRMIVMGGFDGSTFLNDVYALDLNGTPSWSRILPVGSGPVCVRSHLLVYDSTRDRLLLFGGQYGPTEFTSLVWALNLSGTPTWSLLSIPGIAPSGRGMVAGVYDPVGDRVIVHGGWTGHDYLEDLWQFSLSGAQWSRITATGIAPGPLRGHSAVLDARNQRMVFFGGFNGRYQGYAWTLSLGPRPGWGALTPFVPLGEPPQSRAGHSAVFDTVSQCMVIFGGADPALLNDVEVLSLSPPGIAEWSLQPQQGLVWLTSVGVTDDGVVLSWQATGVGAQAVTVERLVGLSWSAAADLWLGNSNRLTWTDTDATDATHVVGYRLAVQAPDGVRLGGAAWVSVPARPTIVIRAIEPNPAKDFAQIAVDQASSASVDIELVDVQGRRVEWWDFGVQSSGNHWFGLREISGLHAGVYLLRVRCGSGRATTKLVIR
jgi:hypothetical protein